MLKRIVVFATLVLGYVLTGMALNASQPDPNTTPVEAASVVE